MLCPSFTKWGDLGMYFGLIHIQVVCMICDMIIYITWTTFEKAKSEKAIYIYIYIFTIWNKINVTSSSCTIHKYVSYLDYDKQKKEKKKKKVSSINTHLQW
jgi:hypothetical protein